MTGILEGLQQRIVDVLTDLARRPLCLFCLLLAANAVALPYHNFFHDANLYGVQTLNRVYPGRYADDLFFQYGNQDKYSLFSAAAAPLAARLGLPAAFFLLYFASNALLLFALQRFIRALVKDPIVSTLALLFVAITQIPFGGMRVFHVNEPFLTPRIAANALVLLGLERLLAGRMAQAWIMVLLALPLHPLMAFPGVLIVAGWLALTSWRTKTLLTVLSVSALAATALLLYQPLAFRLFGRMDGVWRDSVHRVNPYNFPLSWTAEDWLRVALSFTVVLAAVRQFRDDVPRRRLLVAMSGTAAVGLAGGIVVCFLPYALPMQGQPYRCFWPLELALYPLGFVAVRDLWQIQKTAARLAALALLSYLNDTSWDNPILLLLFASAALFAVTAWRGLSAQPRCRDWTERAAVFALGLTLPLWTAIKFGLVLALRQQVAALLEPVEIVDRLAALIDPLCWLALIVIAAALLARLAPASWKFQLACLGVCLASCLLFFALPQTSFYQTRYALHDADERFVADFLDKHPTSGPTPTVYWPTGKIAYLWLDLRVRSYFHVHQIVGNLFSSGNAAEGRRRALLTRAFELDYVRRHQLLYSPRRFQEALVLYETDDDAPSPGREDLLRLCQEQQLDYAVLPQEYPGLYADNNGRFFIYDCRAIRAHLNQTSSRGIASLPRDPHLSND
jgi:hypothetical protein